MGGRCQTGELRKPIKYATIIFDSDENKVALLESLSKILEYDDNRAILALYGPHDVHLHHIEKHYGISVASRGNTLLLKGSDPVRLNQAEQTLNTLYDHIKRGRPVDDHYVGRFLQSEKATSVQDHTPETDVVIHTRSGTLYPHTPKQKEYVQRIRKTDVVFGVGPAGTGKTYLAVAVGVEFLLQHRVKRLILSRPAVEAGERLGFLPGDLREKIDPYLQPLYDALHDMLPSDHIQRLMEMGTIEIAPLAFMRGRTLSDAFIILDEAQNSTVSQMKMFLTRLGQNSKMVVTGDLSQIDLPSLADSGLPHVRRILQDVKAVDFVTFSRDDIMRHPVVAAILEAYDKDAEERMTKGGL